MGELNEHTVSALLLKYNINDSSEIRAAIVEAYDTGYSRGEAEGWENGYENGYENAADDRYLSS
jgi:flagellar biosynthesis/type III secretory pathway protein FliH